MLRGELGIQKHKIPAIIREVFLNSFTPALISKAFETCGIHPLNRNAISKELVSASRVRVDIGQHQNCPLPVDGGGPASCPLPADGSGPVSCPLPVDGGGLASGDHEQTGTYEVISHLTVDVVSPSQVSPNVEIVAECSTTDGKQVTCPPSLALQAIESTLTPRKYARFVDSDARGVKIINDPVYMTWRYLREKVQGKGTPAVTPIVDDHPLVLAGLIPKRLADICPSPPEKKHTRRISRLKAIVLTSEDISNGIREREEERSAAFRQKEERKQAKLRKRELKLDQAKQLATKQIATKRKTNGKKRTSIVTNKSTVTDKSGNQRELFFSNLQATLCACGDYASMEQSCPIELPYALPMVPQRSVHIESSQRDPVSEALIGVRFVGMRSVAVGADGNCLPRTASYISNGTESLHVEMRVRIVHELIAHRALYLEDAFLSRGLATEETRNVALRYAQYSPWYVQGATLTDSDIDQLYKKEVADVIRPGAFCGMWQLHDVASIIGTRIRDKVRQSRTSTEF